MLKFGYLIRSGKSFPNIKNIQRWYIWKILATFESASRPISIVSRSKINNRIYFWLSTPTLQGINRGEWSRRIFTTRTIRVKDRLLCQTGMQMSHWTSSWQIVVYFSQQRIIPLLNVRVLKRIASSKFNA